MRRTSRKDRWVRASILTLGTFVLLVSVVVPLWSRLIYRKAVQRDRANAPLQRGEARIETLTVPEETTLGALSPAQKARATVRFQGRLYRAENVIDPMLLQRGQIAHITYRVGKSGNVYIESVGPRSRP
jgi:hypothetical protein